MMEHYSITLPGTAPLVSVRVVFMAENPVAAVQYARGLVPSMPAIENAGAAGEAA